MRITLTIAVALAMIVCGAAIAQDAEAPAEAAEEAAVEQDVQGGERVQEHLIALYRFDNVIEGTIIPDVTQEFGGLDLVIQGAVQGVPIETIELRESAVHFGSPVEMQIPGLFSADPATDIVNAIKAAGQLTLEAWITPASEELTGPARIVSISRGSGERNITLGQHEDTFALRLRTSATDQQGTPALFSPEGTLRANELQHVVATFDGQTTTIYLNGEPIVDSNHFAGTLGSWDETMHLAIGNETDGDRRWFGSVHLVAFYGYALSPAQVRMNFDAGF
ncbi:MAG: LamG domain-containing protein [Armatimonadota bacterium]